MTLGRRFEDTVEVTPLPAGSVVVISGLRGLSTGTRVQAQMVMALPPLPEARPSRKAAGAADCVKPATPPAGTSSIPGVRPEDSAKGCAAPDNSLVPAKQSPAPGFGKEK